MDLKLFFSPVEEDIYVHINDPQSFVRNISVHKEQMPDHNLANIAIIGVTEYRGSLDNEGVAQAANTIRKKLYSLKKGIGAYKIIDLGDLRNGVDVGETHLRLREVCQYLIEKNILPVIIGGSHDLDMGQFMAYEELDKLISVLNVDAFFDMNEESDAPLATQHTQKILLHEPNYLFSYSHLGYQSYLVDQRMIATFEKLYFEAYRLGHFRQDITEIEPVIRDADMLSFDITAIRATDAPGSRRAQPFGFTGEEACQICWYAGLNQKLSSAGFYEYNPEFDDARETSAVVVATMIWYFIEGFYHRKDEADFKSNDYTKFMVSMPVEPETITFYKSHLSEKWWMGVPYPSGDSKSVFDFETRERFRVIPCSYSDYKTASNGELPDRWINAYSKLI